MSGEANPPGVLPGRAVEAMFSQQAYWCKSLGSPLYARIATAIAHACTKPGPIADMLLPYADDPRWSMLALRFLGALHHLALAGEAPELASHYPSCGGDGNAEAAASAVVLVTKRSRERIAELMLEHPQTNEVARSAALLGGFLEVAKATRLPLRVLEIGASAGLNLRFDRFFYRCGEWSWGDPNAEVVLDGNFESPLPFDRTRIDVVERRGCDLEPIDATTPDGLLRLKSFVWPDQLERLAVLEAAAKVAKRVEAVVDRERAGDWLERMLATPVPGVATVVYHSVVMQYVPAEERAAIAATIARAGAKATAGAPLAHLSLEPRAEPNVALRLYPYDAAERGIAVSTMHGREVRWAGVPQP